MRKGKGVFRVNTKDALAFTQDIIHWDLSYVKQQIAKSQGQNFHVILINVTIQSVIAEMRVSGYGAPHFLSVSSIVPVLPGALFWLLPLP